MTIITVPGMMPNPVITREYYKEILLDEDVRKRIEINGIKEEDNILDIVSSISINNSISVLTIGNKSVDAYLKLTGKISEISARFDIDNDNIKSYYTWKKLNEFLCLASKIDVSGLSDKFVMFRGQKINTLIDDVKKLTSIISEITDNSNELRKMIIDAQHDIINLENELEDAAYEIELSRKAMILISMTSKKYIKDNNFDDIFVSSVKRNIESIESRISGINSTLISKVTTFMSVSDLKRNISIHAYTIDKAFNVFIPSWIKISEDINKTIENNNSLIEFEKNNKENSIFSRVNQIFIDMKNKGNENNKDHEK